jgi:hypothetical protein
MDDQQWIHQSGKGFVSLNIMVRRLIYDSYGKNWLRAGIQVVCHTYFLMEISHR